MGKTTKEMYNFSRQKAIRFMKDDDMILWEKVKELRRKVYFEELGRTGAYYEEDEIDQNAVQFLVYQDDNVVGCFRLNMVAGEWWCSRLVVERQYRNQNFTPVFWGSIWEFALQNSIKFLYIQCIPILQRYYEKLGFQRLGEAYIEDGLKLITMKHSFLREPPSYVSFKRSKL
eukprot:TRINITY_DN4322_c0_g1_i6.p1 TRINITY_DN4322_c0_g1~~TRINITY_DN4322_c0_g1_i6.p1  ORF type:complete len:173 (+),score=13.07 TRINITY_DN4322_c0_g1_i6:37-555(+)